MTLASLKPLSRLKRLDGLERLKNPFGKAAPRLPELPDLGKAVEEENISEEEQLARAIGSSRLARKLIELLQSFPNATIPELIALEWLERNEIGYAYQVPLFGGRTASGGIVLDMLVNYGVGQAYGWRIQGQMIHSLRGRPELDALQESALIGSTVLGQRIGDVIDIYDTRLLDEYRREDTLNLAYAGIEVGP